MAEKEMIVKLGADADLQVFEKYRDLMNDVLGTYDENIEKLAKLNNQIKLHEASITTLNKIQA